jgi:tetratricopeptide (TPR) repeat protein
LLLNRGQLLSQLGRDAEGMKDFERARDDLLNATKQYPNRREFKESLATAYNNCGVNFRIADRHEEAAKVYQSALDIYKDLAEHNADNRRYRHSLIIAARNLGAANLSMKKNEESAVAYQMAIGACRALLNDYPGIPVYQVDLAASLTGLGEVLFDEQKQQGMDSLREAVAILEKLATEQPKNAFYQYQLGNTMGRIEFVFMKGKNWVDAAHWGDLSHKRLRAALAMNTKNARFRSVLVEQLKQHAQSLLETNQINEVASVADELLEMTPGDGEQAFEVACLFGRCAAKSNDDQAGKFGDKAMTALRRAAAGKSIDEIRLRNTPELDALRSRQDFQDLAKQLRPSK